MDASVYGFEFLLTETELSPTDIWQCLEYGTLHEASIGKKRYRIAIAFDDKRQEFVGMVCVARKRTHDSQYDPGEDAYDVRFENMDPQYEFNFFRVAKSGDRGCYTHYIGGISLRNFCRIVRNVLFQKALTIARDRVTAELIQQNMSKSKAEKSARHRFPGSKSMVIGPLVRERQLTNLLEELESFEYFAFKLPEFEADPFSSARPQLRSVSTTLRFEQRNQVKRTILGVIREQIHRFGLQAGSVRGKKAGVRKSIPLNRKTFSLQNIPIKNLLPRKVKANDMLSFDIAGTLASILDQNPDMFEAI